MPTKIKAVSGKFSLLQNKIILAQSHAADGEPAEAIIAIDCALNSNPNLETKKLLEKARDEFDIGHAPAGEVLLDLALTEAGRIASPVLTHTPRDSADVFSTESDGSLVVNGVVVISPSKEFTREQIRLAAAAPDLLAAVDELLKCFIMAGGMEKTHGTLDARFNAAAQAAAQAYAKARTN